MENYYYLIKNKVLLKSYFIAFLIAAFMLMPSLVSAQCANGSYDEIQYATGGSATNALGAPNGTEQTHWYSIPNLEYTNTFTGDAIVVITARLRNDMNHLVGSTYKISFSTDSFTYTTPVVLTDVFPDVDLPISADYVELTYTIPSSVTDLYKYIRIEVGVSNDGLDSRIDAVAVQTPTCYTCEAGADAPVLGVNKGGGSPTFDLTSVMSGAGPSGTSVSWHTATPATTANLVATPSSAAIGAYYAAFYHAGSDCYSYYTATFNVIADNDNDGIEDIIDVDDDNDGILDIIECPTSDFFISGNFNYTDTELPGKIIGHDGVTEFKDRINGVDFNGTTGSTGMYEGWNFDFGTPDWSEGQYLAGSDPNDPRLGFPNMYNINVKPSGNGGTFVIFSLSGEGLENEITTLTIGKTYQMEFEMGSLPSYRNHPAAYSYDPTQIVYGFVDGGSGTGANVLYETPLDTTIYPFPATTPDVSEEWDPHWKKYRIVFEATSTTVKYRFQLNNETVIVVDGFSLREIDDSCTNDTNTNSDGDSCSDSIEAGIDVANLTGTVGDNGLYDALETAPDSGILTTPADVSTFPYDGGVQAPACSVCTPPDDSLAVSDDSICPTATGTITLTSAQVGVTYQLRLDSNDSNVGASQVGAGADLTFNVTPASTTVYNLYAVDGACNVELTDKSTVTVNITPSAPAATDVDPTCAVATGSVSVTSPVGTSTYTLTGTAPVVAAQTGTSFTTLAAGTYSLTETNAAGCTSPALSITIDAQPATPSAPAATDVDPTCAVATGSVSVTSPVGTSTYTLTGTAPVVAAQTGTSFSSLAAGTYSLTETNAAGCISAATTITIDAQPATPSAPAATDVDPTCAVATGSVSVTSPVGTSTYTLTGTAPVVAAQTGTSFTTLAAGTYSLTETNAAGCISAATTITIDAQPATPSAPAATDVDPTCAVATGSVSVTSPVGTSTYTLTGTAPVVAAQTGTSFTTLAAGTYSLTETNAAGCTSPALSITIDAQPATPSAPAATDVDPTCAVATGSVSVTSPVGTSTYTLTGTAPVVAAQTGTSFTTLAAGTYSLTETNAAGCISAATTITIDAQPATPSAPAATDVDPTCAVATGSVSVTSPVGTSTYTLTGTAPVVVAQTGTSFSSLAAGTYSLTETNAAGCISATTTITIDAQPATPSAPAATDVDPTCAVATGSVSVTSPVGTSTYTLTGTAPVVAAQTGTSFTTLAAGTYSLTETNAAGCISAATTITIDAQPATPSAPAATDVDPTCAVATGSVSVTSPVGTSTYTLTGTAPVVAAQTGTSFTTLAAGTYSLTETNAAGCTSPALSITIDAQPNCPPVAQDDTASTTVDALVNLDVLASNGNGVDADADNDPLTITDINGTTPVVGTAISVTGGTVTLLANGTLDIQPDGTGAAITFPYTISDGNGGTDTANVDVSIGNTAPVAQDDTASTTVDALVNLDVLASNGNGVDADVDNDPLTITDINGTTPVVGTAISVTGGTVTLLANGTLDIQPDGTGTAITFPYTISDGNGGTDTANVDVAIGNTAPVAQDDTASTTVDALVNLDVLASNGNGVDADADNDPLTIIDINGTTPVVGTAISVTGGTVTLLANGTLDIQPDGTGTAITFPYTISDGNGGTDTANVDVSIGNTAPVAQDDTASTTVDALVNLDVLASNGNGVDADVDNDPLTITDINGTTPVVGTAISVTGGTVTLLANGTLDIQPDGTGTAITFPYTISDGNGGTDTANVDVSIGNTAPVAQDDTASTTVDALVNLDVLASNGNGVDADADNDPLTITDINGTTPVVGTAISVTGGTVTLLANGTLDIQPDGTGAAITFPYTISDGNGGTDTANVDVSIGNTAPVAQDDTASTTVDALVNLDVLASNGNGVDADADNDPLTIIDINGTTPVVGTAISVTGGTVTLLANGTLDIQPDGTGAAITFPYTISDGNGGTDTANVDVAIGNTAPVAQDDTASTTVDALVNLDVLASNGNGVDADADNDPLTIIDINGTTPVVGTAISVTGGTVTLLSDGTLDIQPDGTGAAITFPYTISDGNGGTDTANVDVAIGNTAPVAQDDTASTTVDALVNLDVLASNGNGVDADADNDPLTIIDINGTTPVVGTPISVTGGTVTLLANGTLDIQPDGTGAAITFPYTISDGNGGTDTANVDVAIGNTAPVAQDDTASTTVDALVNLDVLASNGNGVDADADNDPLTIIDINGTTPVVGTAISVTGGTVTLLANGTLDIQPDGTGAAITFPYTISDGNGGTDTANVDVAIGNTAPVAQDDTASTTVDALVNLDVLASNGNGVDADADNDPLTIIDINGTTPVVGTAISVTGGTVTLLANGTLDIQPDGTGAAITFPYTISDGNGGTDTANVDVAIGNTAPVAQDDTASTTVDALVNLDVLASNGNGVDADADNDPLTIIDINGTTPVVGTAISVTGGTVTLLSDGTLDIQPDGTGAAITFPYTISDGNGGTDTANVDVAIGNTAPVAQDDTASTTVDALVNLDVLASNGNGVDADADNDPLTIIDINGTTPVVGTAISVTGGTVTLLSDGTLDIQPDGTGAAITFPYTISDGNGGTDTANVDVAIGNTAPVAQDDTASTTVDALVNLDVLASNGNGVDADADNDPLTIIDINGTTPVVGTAISVTGGTVTLLANGTLDIQPDGTGAAITFPYTISDGNGGTDTANVDVAIGNTAPVAQDDTASTTVDALVNLDVLASNGNGVDADADNDPLTIIDINGTTPVVGTAISVTGGTVTLLANGTLDIQPDGTGAAITFPYTISDGNGGTDTANVDVAIGNTAPVAQDDTASTTVDALVNLDVLASNGNGVDADADNDPLTIIDINGTTPVVGTPISVTGGTVTLLANGTLDIQPDGTGAAITFPYTISDGNGGTDTANVDVAIGNTAPVAQDDTASTTVDALVNLDVLASNGNGVDADADNDPLTIIDINGTTPVVGTAISVTGGTVTLLANGTLDIQPDGTGAAITFPYTISDGNGGTDTANVDVSIGNTAPVAQDDTASTTVDALVNLDVLASNGNGVDADADNDPLTITDINGTTPVVGTAISVTGGTVTLLANGTLDIQPDGTGAAITFPYTISDGNGGTDTANVDVSIGNTAPVAQDDTASTTVDALVNLDVLASNGNGVDADADNDPLTITDINGTTPVVGTAISVTGGTVTLLANGTLDIQPDGTGAAITFQYTISDGNGGTDTANVDVAIGNTAPVAEDDTASTTVDALVNLDVLASNGNGVDADADNDPLTIIDINGTTPVVGTAISVTGGTVTLLSDGTLDIQPDGTGAAITFPYTISDGNGGTDTANVDVAIGNTAPVAQDDTASTTVDALVNLDVLASNGNGVDADADNDPLTIIDINGTTPVVGTAISVTGGTVTLLANGTLDIQPDGTGVAITFPYTISDGNGGTDTANVDVAIGNTAPVAQDDTASTTVDALVNLDVLASNGNGVDADADNDPLTIIDINGTTPVVGTPISVTGGTVTLLANGTLDIQPDGTGAAITFPYTISDGNGGTDTANVDVAIGNTAPVAQDDTASTTVDALVNLDVLASNGNGVDADADNDPLTIIDINGTTPVVGTAISVTGGTVTLLANGTLDIQPDGTGAAITFPYTISDGNGGTDTANVDVAIGNTAPVAQDDTASTTVDALVNLDVLASNGNGVDADADNDPLTIIDINGTTPVVGTPISVTGGTVTLLANGTLDIQPDGTGTEITFPYTISDGNGGTDTADIDVKIELPNTITAIDDNYTSTPITIGNDTPSVTINDTLNGIPVTLGTGVGEVSLLPDPNGTNNDGFTFNSDGTISIGLDVEGGTHVLEYQICENGALPINCKIATVTILVNTDTNPCGTPYNIMTPDNDGDNDAFFISCIDKPEYAKNTVEIFNRWGNTVYKASGYNNESVAFTGISNGRSTISVDEKLPPGTYYYVIDLGDGSKPKVGWLYINR
ncbi:Ig-like domain-containing protein [Tenacibaculum salmonis]|uniref:Ig-like domain-containing protein n=1 Tax=Tenacibaculum sp. P3-BQ1 TaxID=3232310 RepID=UPI0034DF0375